MTTPSRWCIETNRLQSGEVLFEIIMRRYETRSTMMTSNRPLEDWGKLIGDVPDDGSNTAIPPAGSKRKKAVRRRLPTRPRLAKSNRFNEDSIPTTPAAEFRSALAAFQLPDDTHEKR